MGGPAAGQATFRHPSPATATTCPAPPARKGSTTRASAHTNATTAPLTRFGPGGQEAAEKITKRQQNGPLLRRTCLTVAAPPRKAPTPSGEVRQGSAR
jgi:hypothetical protein